MDYHIQRGAASHSDVIVIGGNAYVRGWYSGHRLTSLTWWPAVETGDGGWQFRSGPPVNPLTQAVLDARWAHLMTKAPSE